MRKDFVAVVLANVQNKVNSTMGQSGKLSPETLLDTAKAYGLIEGKRGRDGGYQATDAGLAFVGENVEEFKVREAAADAEAEETAKKTRKAEKAAKAAELATKLADALKTAA
jgi:DNA-binding PadR family transcriptional regulator